MTGAQLKSEIKRRGYTIKSVAQHMGTSAQNLGNKLVGDDVASGLIEAAAEVMGISPADFYRTGDTITARNNSLAFKGNNSVDTRLLDIIQQRDRQLDRAMAQTDKALAQMDQLLSLFSTSKQTAQTPENRAKIAPDSTP